MTPSLTLRLKTLHLTMQRRRLRQTVRRILWVHPRLGAMCWTATFGERAVHAASM